MNTNDTRFDRLVDDELSEEERRELLDHLDDEPGGWRRCALAFLESQCWKQSFRPMPDANSFRIANIQPAATTAGEMSSLDGATPLPHVKNPPRSSWPGRLSLVSAMAASFLVAMWLGSVAHRAWVSGPSTGVDANAIAHNGGVHSAMQPNVPNASLAVAPRPRNVIANPWHTVTVSDSSDGRGPRRMMDVPAVERNNIDEQWVRSVPAAIPDNVMQALHRTGHQVEQQRELVPVPLQDGRRLVMPVDRVNVHYVGNGTL